MKIRLKIIMLAGVLFVWGLAFSVAGAVTVAGVQKFTRLHLRLEDARGLLRQLNVLTLEYLLYPTERGRQQWESVYAKAQPVLNDLPLGDFEDGQTIFGLRRRLPYAQRLFRDFVSHEAMAQKFGQGQRSPVDEEYRSRVITQLVLENQRIITSVARLQASSFREYQRFFQTIVYAVVIFLLFFGAGIIAVYFWVHRVIVYPLLQLRKSVLQIASGNWNYRIDVTKHDEIGDLARSFQAMAASLREQLGRLEESEEKLQREVVVRRKAEFAKDELMRTVSHELRTPLSILKEAVMILIEKSGDAGVSEEHREVLRIAKDSSARLGRIINDLLDVFKLESGRVELKKGRFDLGEAVAQISSNFGKVAEEKGLKILRDLPKEPVFIFADREGVDRVLMNLMGNAVKFTKAGSVTVSLALCGGEVECCVTDTGVGIEPENLPKVFGKFQQFNREPVAGEHGTGLGLSIARDIIEMHKGRIWVESKFGEGTSFHFTLPLGPTGQ